MNYFLCCNKNSFASLKTGNSTQGNVLYNVVFTAFIHYNYRKRASLYPQAEQRMYVANISY